MERALLYTRGVQDFKEDYCGLELYLSPEKGENTVVTTDLISEEVNKFAKPENVRIGA